RPPRVRRARGSSRDHPSRRYPARTGSSGSKRNWLKPVRYEVPVISGRIARRPSTVVSPAIRPVKSSPRSPRLVMLEPTRMRPRWWNSAIRAQVPDPHGAARHGHRHLAQGLDLDALPGEHDEGRRPAQGDLADAVAVGARDRLDDAGLGVDDDGRLGAEPLNHPGLDGHGRRADRALTAG